MKKMTAILMALILLLTTLTAAFAEEAADMSDVTVEAMTTDCEPDPYAAALQGLVMGWNEDGAMLVRDQFGQLYQVNIEADYTNLEDAQFVTIGDFVTVLYDGRLSRSIPAQLTASYICCFAVTGTVTALTEDGFTMLTDDDMELQVAVDETVPFAPITEGASITVYYNGMMTRSIPARINALYLRSIDLYGQVLEIMEDGSILLQDEQRGEVIVRMAEETIVYTEIHVGEMVCIASTGMMTMSLPAQLNAIEVLSMAVPAM